jgi:hypothetical protein
MKMPVVLSLCLLVAAGSAAYGQDVAPAPKTATVPDASVPPETRIAAALDLLKATHAADNMDAMLDAIAPMQVQVMKDSKLGLDDAAMALVIKKLRENVIARRDEYLRIYAIEYARHFDEQELRDLAAFYRSPLGERYIASVPSLLREVAPVVMQWMMSVEAQTQQDILKSLPQKPNPSP